ncbi:TerC/Alx family metal homeostasis membrane protein [Arsenophonus symbiont of Ornithomya chloropus]|uniref:TerC/Alx family metal homeostasis membrane protein n=1 Tax=Arsenophonus symbiont of Ornithomya chloropus TaxID=634121 RepID=UPI0032B22C0A
MYSIATPVLWWVFIVFISIMFFVDLCLQYNNINKTIKLKQAIIRSIIWIQIVFLFALYFWFYLKQYTTLEIANHYVMDFLTSYLLEKALAIDNVFVWMMLFNYFSIPIYLQHKVLFYGVFGAIFLRSVMIFAGTWLITKFYWIFYVFGIFLIFSGIKIFSVIDNIKTITQQPLIQCITSHLRITNTLYGENFFIRQKGILFGTPLILVLMLVEISDIIFAFDSIPAVFSVTMDPFIVFTSNLFAILGLRVMYFVLLGIVKKFIFFKYGISFILIFIGIKMLLTNLFYIPTSISLSIIISILVITLFINYIFIKK